jgi:hypothetical protein
VADPVTYAGVSLLMLGITVVASESEDRQPVSVGRGVSNGRHGLAIAAMVSASSTVQKHSLYRCADRWETRTIGLSSKRSDDQTKYDSNARHALCSGASHDLARRDKPRDDLGVSTKRRANSCCRECSDVLSRCAAHSRGTVPDLSSCGGNCACAIRNLRTNATLCGGNFRCDAGQVHAAVVCRSAHWTFFE